MTGFPFDARHVGVLDDLSYDSAPGGDYDTGALGDRIHLNPDLEGHHLIEPVSFLDAGSVGSAVILRLVLG
jgi:hypothetical protein